MTDPKSAVAGVGPPDAPPEMNRAEQNVAIAADLYDARRAAMFLLGERYVKTLRPYQNLIARVMNDEGLPVLRAALKIGQSLPPSDAIPLMCVMAAAVEMIENPASTRDKETL